MENKNCKYKEPFEPMNAECVELDTIGRCLKCAYREKWWDLYMEGQAVKREMIAECGEDYYD